MALDIRIAGRYRLGRKIGSGSFGDIYLGMLICRADARVMLGLLIYQQGSCPKTIVNCWDLLLHAGTHIQTGEEVGIKLVRASAVITFQCFLVGNLSALLDLLC